MAIQGNACLLLNLAICSAAAAEPGCNIVAAPAKFQMEAEKDSTTWRPSNAGIKPTGFVQPATPVVHGIDVSKYQDEANFSRANKCGARFAYVRLSAGVSLDNELTYRVHWGNARNADLIPGPYHSLSVIPDALRLALNVPGKENLENQASLTELAESQATAQADNFLKRLNEVRRLDPKSTPEKSYGYLPVALALTADPAPGRSQTVKSKVGEIYSRMACTWLKQVSTKLPSDAPVIFITTPQIFSDYNLDQSCDMTKYIGWVSHRPVDGEAFYRSKNETKSNNVLRLCGERSSNGRCRFDQYTSYGGFAVYTEGAPLDLDRFYGTEAELNTLVQVTP